MSDIIKKLKVTSGKGFKLKDYDTGFTGGYNKADAGDILKELIAKTDELQTKLYADNRFALLIIFQAMDAAGKDSAIKHTMTGLNPQGCQVYSFKQPSAEDYDHDFLWRHYKALPERGRVGIHNRSHYENVLVTRVHPQYVMKENLPAIDSVKKIDKKFWEGRYKSIRNFEQTLDFNGTKVIKFFLNVSKEEQKERFLKRIEDPEKNWKFSAADLEERKHWNDYMEAYEDAIAATATPESPWFVIPADKKWFTRIAISTIILDTLKQLDLKYPVLPEADRAELANLRMELQNE